MKFFPGFSVFCKLFFQLILFKKLFLFQCRVTSENTDEGGERFQFPQCRRHFRIFLIAQKVDVEEIFPSFMSGRTAFDHGKGHMMFPERIKTIT